MQPTQVLQEIRKMRFWEAYEGWSEGRLTTPAVSELCQHTLHVTGRGLGRKSAVFCALWVITHKTGELRHFEP